MSICPHCGNHCPTPRHSEKLRSLFAARVGMVAKVNRRNLDAAHNEMATAIRAADEAVMRSLCVPADVLTSGNVHATATEHTIRAAIDGDARAIRTVVRHAEDVIDPRSACVEPRRAVGFVEFKPTAQNIVDALRAIEDITGEEPERFDEATGPFGGGM